MQKSNKRNRLKKILSDHFFNDKKKKKSEYYTTNIPPKRRYFSKEYEGIINRINKTVARFDDVIKMAREAGKEDIILRLEKIKKAIIERQDLLIKLKKEIESRKKQEDVLNALASNSLSTQDPLSVLLDIGAHSYKFFNKKKREVREEEFSALSDSLRSVLVEHEAQIKKYLEYLKSSTTSTTKKRKKGGEEDTQPPPVSTKIDPEAGGGGEGSGVEPPKELTSTKRMYKEYTLSQPKKGLPPPIPIQESDEDSPSPEALKMVEEDVEKRLNEMTFTIEDFLNNLQNDVDRIKKDREKIVFVPVEKKEKTNDDEQVKEKENGLDEKPSNILPVPFLEKKIENIEKNTNPINKLPEGLESIKNELNEIKNSNIKHYKFIEDTERDRQYEKRDTEDKGDSLIIPPILEMEENIPLPKRKIITRPEPTYKGPGRGINRQDRTIELPSEPKKEEGGGVSPLVTGIGGLAGGALGVSKGGKIFDFLKKGARNVNVGLYFLKKRISSGISLGRIGKGSSFISKLMAPGGKFLASKVGKILPFLGPGIYLLSQLGGEKPLKEKLMRGGGGLGGMLLGAKLGGALGASAGSIIPFAGTAVGGILGATLGSSLGAFFGEGIGGKVYKNFFGEVEKSEPGSEKSPWRNERRINLDIPKSRTFEKIEGSGGVFKRDSQLEKLKKILGEKLAFEAAQVAATEGGIDKEGNLKTDAINKQSLAAGLFQFLPSVGVDTISRIDDKSIKEKFQKYIDELEKNKKLSSESREEVAKLIASLNEEEQATIYKKYIEPLAVAKGGYENLTAEDLKSYGLSPMAELTNSDDDMVVYKKGTPAYDQNPYLDLDKDGVITKGEIRSYSEKLMKNRTTAFNRFLRKNMENSVKMEVGSTENGWTVASLTQKPLSPSVSEEREEKREVIRPQPVLIASRRAIAPETSELAKEATTQSQQSSTPSPQPTTIVVDNRSVLTQRSNSSQRMEIATVRNTDPTIQKALEKSYFS